MKGNCCEREYKEVQWGQGKKTLASLTHHEVLPVVFEFIALHIGLTEIPTGSMISVEPLRLVPDWPSPSLLPPSPPLNNWF